MARVGLVLGAGGVVGHAFHAGVLTALAEATGWDPDGAEVVVGTSAGSVVGSLLRAGFPAADLYARATGGPLSAPATRLVARAGLGAGPPTLPSRPPRSQGRRTMASPEMFLRAALAPLRVRPGALVAAAMPEGEVPSELVAGGLRPLFRSGWPDRPLWICALRLGDGRRVVFGREGAPAAGVAEAVAASCAIPGFFEPVTIESERYVDGGAHSLTNAALLARLGLDLVVISSPMSAAGRGLRPSIDLPARQLARASLGREAVRIRRRGTPVLAFQPTFADLDVMGLNAMDPERRGPVARQARESTLRRLERADVRDRLASLSAR